MRLTQGECLYMFKAMTKCHRHNSAVLPDLGTSDLSGLHIGIPDVVAGNQLTAVTTAMLTPPSSQKNSCTKSISLPEEDSGFGPD